MVKPYAYDVEVLPNFFSITIINVKDYMEKFADCVNTKGKPIPLVQKLTVKEIKERLNAVTKHKFYITDKDDSQLLQMVSWFNQCRYHDNIRTDIFGYNSMNYDKLMVAAFLMFFNNCNNSKELITKLYDTSKKIISLQDNPDASKRDFFLDALRKYSLPYVDIDIMRIFALNKVGKGTNSKGETIYFGKSLKQTSINLQWYELLEYELPPISDKDIHYYHKINQYKGLDANRLNQLVEKWDRYIIDEWIEPTMHYNANDVFIVCEMLRLFNDEVGLRYTLSQTYKVNLLNASRSHIADELFTKYYSDFSGLAPSQWRGKKTDRTIMSFNKVIFSFIQFKTPELQELLNEMKRAKITSIGIEGLGNFGLTRNDNKYLKVNKTNKSVSGYYEITINKLTYTIATGGLHSKDIPRKLISKVKYINDSSSTGGDIWSNITDDSFIYVHYDIASFYPSLMSVYNIAPEHLNNYIFVKLITWLKDTRVKAKHSVEPLVDGIPKKIMAEALKIVINSIYGKLGFEKGDICDRMAVLKVTINGQLMVMMLCEELELNGIEVVSANTDGIVIKLYKKDKKKFDSIASTWLDMTGLGADSEEYKYYINRDINNYFIEELNGKTDSKGSLNDTMYLKSLDKGYDMPIVATAVVNYFTKNKPVMQTLYEATNILDFCKTQNIGKQFHVEFTTSKGKEILQRNVRYYISNEGGVIEKVHNQTYTRNGLAAGQKVIVLNTLDDKNIALRDIKYSYYYEEAYKIINPIELQISPNQKGNANAKTKSGKALIKKYSHQFNTLFDDEDY